MEIDASLFEEVQELRTEDAPVRDNHEDLRAESCNQPARLSIQTRRLDDLQSKVLRGCLHGGGNEAPSASLLPVRRRENTYEIVVRAKSTERRHRHLRRAGEKNPRPH